MDLSKYKAKSNSQSIEQHNNDLNNINKEIIDIYNISNEMNNKLNKCILFHDIGKATDVMQKILEGEYENKKLKVRHEVHSASLCDLEIDERLAILTHHKGLNDLIFETDSKYYLQEQKELEEKLDIKFENIDKFIKKMNRPRVKETKDLNTILLKGFLNYCDHLGSAGIKEIDKGFNSIEDFKIPNGFKYNSIQKKVLQLKDKEDILILAMTGLGKTATSMYWSDNVQNKEKSKRIYYLLPFTASINSLFKEFDIKNISVSMLHNKAEYFLNKIKEDFTHDDYKLLKYSNKQINICTIFQLVKAIFSCKRYEMLLAQMKNSIFIVDEIHCFATKELCYILELLKWLKDNFQIKICIMSASIPTCMQELIKDRLDITKVLLPNKNDLIVRHKIHRKNKTILDDIDKIKKLLLKGKQVIICVNNVKTSQQLYKEFSEKYQCKLIHSRFNSRDREKAEQDLKINALLIGTQAIEVSLDISYDVMFTEIAPFDALLQRFGRINRKGEKGLSNLYIYNNYNKYIYEDKIIENTDKVISEILDNDNAIIYESKVNYYLDKVYTKINMDDYNSYKEKLHHIIKNLKVGFYNENVTDDMCTIDSIQVIPKALQSNYIELINNKNFLEAEALKVNIPHNRIYDKENVYYDETFKVFIANYKYNENIGLEFEVDFDSTIL